MNCTLRRYSLVILPLLILLSFRLPAQRSYTDSLEKVLASSRDPAKRMVLLNQLSNALAKTNPERSLDYALKALDLAEKQNNKVAIASGSTNVGNSYFIKGNYPQALKMYLAAEKMLNELGDRKGMAGSYMGIGNVYYTQGDLPKAREYYLKAMVIREELNDKNGMSGCYNNLGNLYQMEKSFEKALEYHQKSLKLKLELGDYKGLSSSYGNIGLSLFEMGQYDSALVYQQKALKLRQELNNKAGQSASYINIASIYEKMGRQQEAITYLEKALELSKSLGYKEGEKNAYASLSNAWEKQGDFAKSLEYFRLYSEVKDTLLNEDTRKQVATLQTIYETEKKEKEIILLTKERAIQDLVLQQQEDELIRQTFENEKKRAEIELLTQQKRLQAMEIEKKQGEIERQKLLAEANARELRAQRMVRNFTIAGLGMVMLLAFFIYRGYRLKKKSNIELSKRNEEIRKAYTIIEQNRDEIAQKNKDIQDSINYAQRIQQAILPPIPSIKAAFPDSFVLYKPRDIVSGDFYAFIEKNGKTIVAAVDCTGHGVPGAFMSMIGTDQLNQIIMEHNITRPAEILSRLNKGIRQALKQGDEDSDSRDGMDIAICAFDLKSNVVEFAGAQRPLWYISNGVFTEIKANELPIGGSTAEDYSFTNHTFGYSPGDAFYLFSDGYVDQFGGAQGKKFMSRRFKELVMDIYSRPMNDQHALLLDSFEHWKQDIDQVDDVLVLGVRV
jgi:tetratricopeptide (TPR) repeat protein/serine phosphatase RsbU (regulator of sigma subunit)